MRMLQGEHVVVGSFVGSQCQSPALALAVGRVRPCPYRAYFAPIGHPASMGWFLGIFWQSDFLCDLDGCRAATL
jgi:hypothetical protein